MSTLQQNPTNGFSPILLSPSSTTNPTIINPHLPFYDNSDQGSVDSDYTSLSSSKFYGHGGSTSSLHRQGRSQSIDELASTTVNTTTIPTRHFNGISNVNKSNADPLQFVKIHPNHDLIERAQEQLTLAESRKRLQETFQLITPSTTSNKTHLPTDEDETNWSKAVENWRQRREQKRKQSVNANRSDDEPSTPVSADLQPSSLPSRFEKSEPIETKISPMAQKFVPSTTPIHVELEPPKTTRLVSKSPSPQRIRGPAKVHEISIEKPLLIRGFGFKLEDGTNHHRSVYISTIEDGSPADKAGLCIDDEVLAMNGENIEHMTFDQVRKILKERNLRGSIKLLVRTYEDVADDNSQTVTTGPATDHSRTPSPQKPLTHSQSNPSAPPLSTSTSTIRLTSSMSTSTSNEPSPIYTFLPCTSAVLPPKLPPPPPPLNEISMQPSSASPSSTNSIEQQPVGNTLKVTSQNTFNTLSLTNNSVPLNVTTSLTSPNLDNNKPVPLTSVETLLHGTPTDDSTNQQRNESPITQVRSSVEKQMNQLQQELLLGFPHTSNDTKRDQRPIPIPIDLTNAALPKSALKKSTSQPQELNSNKMRPCEHLAYPTNSSNYVKRSVHDSSTGVRTTQSVDRPPNELRINSSSLYSTQPVENVSVQVDNKTSSQRISSKQVHTTLNQAPKKANYEDRSWIINDLRTSIPHQSLVPPQIPSFHNGNIRRSAQETAELPIHRTDSNQLTMFHYGEHNDELHYQSQHVEPHRDVNTTVKHKQQAKSPIRTTISSNNNRVLSVSGKLRCSRCNDELGQGSAMVIESLGLYYHIECFRCFVCNIPLSSSFEGTDVRVRDNRLHCQNCFSDDHGAWRSNV